MPLLPWKTTRASRISQIVADLQSPKRGGSLVVETGFPTSIVDLFVKHRDRFRKPSARRKSKKKRSSNEIHDSITQLSSSSSPPPPTSQLDPTGSAGGCLRGDLEIDDLKVLDEVRVVCDRGCELVPNRAGTCDVGGGAAGGNGVCMVALKMFVVAVLALSTKKLVVGITLSASLLLLLEFVGKRAVRFLKPCTHGEAALRSLTHKVSRHLWIGKDDLVVVQNSVNCEGESIPKVSRAREDVFRNESFALTELGSSLEEIQLVELEPDVGAGETPKGIQDETHHLSFLGGEKGNKDGAELSVCGNQRGTRGKRNRRMFEKLVRKKSGGQSIEKKNREDLEFGNDGFNHLEPDKVAIEEQVNEEQDENLEQEQDRETRSILCQEEQDNRKPPNFDEQWQAMEVAESCEIQRIKREGSLSYPILVIVVLAGLFGGRLLAVVLTTAGCFTVRLNGISRRRCLNPPLQVDC